MKKEQFDQMMEQMERMKLGLVKPSKDGKIKENLERLEDRKEMVALETDPEIEGLLENLDVALTAKHGAENKGKK